MEVDLKNLKIYILFVLFQKTESKRIYNQTQRQRRKEKKRLMIEQIKEERKENSLLFDGI